MSLRAEEERLSTLMADVDKWNGLTEAERARWLHQDKWAPINAVATMLTPDQVKVLQEHPDFRDLRIAYDECIYGSGASIDSVNRLTDMFMKAVGRL